MKTIRKTTTELMKMFDVSRQAVHKKAQKFGWKSTKIPLKRGGYLLSYEIPDKDFPLNLSIKFKELDRPSDYDIISIVKKYSEQQIKRIIIIEF